MSTKHASGITDIGGGWSDPPASRSTIALYEPPLAGRARCTSAVPRASLPFKSFILLANMLVVSSGSPGRAGFPLVSYAAAGKGVVQLYDGGPAVVADDQTTDPSDREIHFSAADASSPWGQIYSVGSSVIGLDVDSLKVLVTTETSYSAYLGPAVGGEVSAEVNTAVEFTMPADEVWWSSSLGADGYGEFQCAFVGIVSNLSLGLTVASFDGGLIDDARVLYARKGDLIRVRLNAAASGVAPADDREGHHCAARLELTFTDVDCNNNDVYDPRDVERGTSADDNADGVPDECDAPIIYVNANAPEGGDGSSWDAAFTDLQEALDLATRRSPEVSPIWVAAGRYVPTRRTDEADPRSVTFTLDTELDLFGGFAGHETRLTERNPEANPTILSGDLLGDDEADFVNYDENAYHVVTAIGIENVIIFDGLTVTGGHAPGSGFFGSYGGGLYVENARPEIRNCTFTRNLAERPAANVSCSGGGGAALFMYQEGQDPVLPPLTVSRSRFTDNKSDGDGGAVFIYGSYSTGSVIFSECSFERNVGNGAFSGWYGSTYTFRSCTFLDNSSQWAGGAISTPIHSGELLIDRCHFERNTARSGGAVYWSGWGRAAIHDSVFVDNSAEFDNSGALRLSDVDEIDLIDCEFRGNSAGYAGGAYLAAYTSTTVQRCQFAHNSAYTGNAGGLFVDGPASLVDCTFLNNHARDSGGGLATAGGSTLLVGCTFTQNSADEGGGVYDYSNELTVVDAAFERNYATLGGGVAAASYSGARFERCRFAHNSAYIGGGVEALGGADFLFDRCEFTDNGATIGGGLCTLDKYADTRVTNCLFAGNSGYAYGGGIAGGAGMLLVDNCTIADNTADAVGAGIIAGHETTITNSIIWGNVTDPGGGAWSDEVAQIEGIEFATIDYSNVQGWSGTYGGDGNIGLDPLFVAPADPDGLFGPMERDLHLRPESPCINAGLTETPDPGPWDPPPPNLDLDGKPRVLCDLVDIGAYEFGLTGDVDCNLRVDLVDFSLWPQCAFGPGAPSLCSAFDADGDGDVDLRDAAAVFRAFPPGSESSSPPSARPP